MTQSELIETIKQQLPHWEVIPYENNPRCFHLTSQYDVKLTLQIDEAPNSSVIISNGFEMFCPRKPLRIISALYKAEALAIQTAAELVGTKDPTADLQLTEYLQYVARVATHYAITYAVNAVKAGPPSYHDQSQAYFDQNWDRLAREGGASYDAVQALLHAAEALVAELNNNRQDDE